LLGGRALPLREAGLYGRLAAWDIADLESGEQVAEVRMRYSVALPPGPIQLPYLSDVTPSEVTLNWSRPLEDRGMPVVGYRVALWKPRAATWLTLCECRPSTTFVVGSLAAGSTYIVDIRAVSDVGVGDPSQLEVLTANANADPPLQEMGRGQKIEMQL